MVTNVSSARYLFTPSLFHAQRSGRTQVPVRPSDTVYAHFDHVEGIPSRNNTIPLIKLRILDKLIARLAGIQQETGAEPAAASVPISYSSGNAVSATPYSVFLSPASEPGTLVNVFA